jgi:hypothetical protein
MQHLDAKAQERDSCLHPHRLVIKSPTAVGKGGGDGKFYPANISTSLLHHRHHLPDDDTDDVVTVDALLFLG